MKKALLPQSKEWKLAQESYTEALLLKSKKSSRKIHSELERLDFYVHKTLPDTIRSRTPMHITKQELIELSKFKLLRGTFRGGFIQRLETNTDKQVIQVSTEAFKKMKQETISNIADAILILNTLTGVGCATSSLILAILYPTVPFMNDEVLNLSTPSVKKISYLLKDFHRVYTFVAKLREKVDATAFEITDWIWAWTIYKSVKG